MDWIIGPPHTNVTLCLRSTAAHGGENDVEFEFDAVLRRGPIQVLGNM